MMKKFYLFTKTLLVATILLVGGATSAYALTETFGASKATTKNTAIVGTSVNIHKDSNPSGAGQYLVFNNKTDYGLKLRTISGSTPLTLVVNSGYKVTKVKFYAYQNNKTTGTITCDSYAVDGAAPVAFGSPISVPLNVESASTQTLAEIQTGDIVAKSSITFNFTNDGASQNQIYAYIEVTYEERNIATEVYNFEGWTTADAVVTQATGDGTTFNVDGVDTDGTRNMTMASHVTIGGVEHSFGNRLALDNYSSGSSFGWRFRNGSNYQKGLVTQGKSPNWSPYYFSICNLNVGDIVKVTYSYKGDKDAQPYFVSTNASAGGVAVVANTTKMVSGTEYTITAAGHLDLVVKDNNFGMHKLEIIREVSSKVESAIADIKSYENSRAFAAYIDDLYDKGSLTTVADVYAAHTAWQISQADAASSNDITKVIFDAAVSDFTYWNNARNNSDQQYTGAPDAKYFDGWDNQASDAKQKIYGLPAGTYTLKVATRASETLIDKSKYKVWVYGGSADVSVLGSHIGSSGGNLGNGWNWTILSFTLTAKADVEIGFYALPGEGTGLWAGCDDFHLYKGMLAENVSVTVSEAGYATLVSPYALNFTSTDIKAYTAVVDTEKGIVNLTQKNQIPSNTPVVLYYAGGKTENIPVIGAADALGDNDLKAGTGGAVATGTNPYNYILNNVSGIGFYKAAGKTVAADRAYLQTTYASGARGMTLVLDDDILTGINEAKSEVGFAKEGKFVVDGKLVIFKKGMKFNANGQVIK